ncbi:MAG TPA: sulfotransferase, partial [Mucilaginibacter sp.]|nr:sulfotransferase [Mucilaginibacter sp.]
MHRSGTSLVTNWLHSCGLQVGEELLGDAPGNTEGHFEDMEFLKMHEEILLSNNLPDTGLTSGTEPAVSDYQREKIRSIIDVKNTRFEQWGWKEPRTCLLLGLYHELLPEAKYLVIVRDYKSVVNSLLKRDFFVIDQRYLSRIWLQRLMWKAFKRESRKKDYYKENAEYYLKVWIWYNEYVLDHLKKLTRDQYLVVDYT